MTVVDTRCQARSAVLDWYAVNGRDPRLSPHDDPWAILVSEVMAQQTQASRAADGMDALHGPVPDTRVARRRVARDGIRAWRGLGYNRRALALLAAA